MDKIAAGTTNVSVVFAVKNIYAITAFRGTYTRWSEGGAASAFSTPVSFAITALTALSDAHTDNKGIYISAVVTDGSKYLVRVDFPDAAFTSGADRVVCSLYDDADEEIAQRIYTLNGEVVDLYGGKIWIDTNNGTAGTIAGKNGTADNPVDSIADAMTLSAALGIKTLHFAQRSSASLSADLDEFLLEGSDYIIDLNSKKLDSTVIDGAWISGSATTNDDEVTFKNSILGIIGLPGGTRCFNCKLTGQTVLLDISAIYTFDKCSSFAYSATDPIIQYYNDNIDVSITGYEGVIGVRDMGAYSGATLEITGKGTFKEDTGCISGSPKITGVWKLEDITNLTPDAYAESGVNLTHIDDEPTNDYQAHLKLKSLDIQNNNGNAITAKSTGGGFGHGLEAQGDGFGEGIKIVGGASADGINTEGGSILGAGMRISAQAGNSSGLIILGEGDGDGARIIAESGGTGDGLQVTGGTTGYDISAKEIAAIQAKTDKLPHSIKKNTAIPYFFFVMLDATTGEPVPGVTVTAKRKLDGAASWTTMTGTITDVGSGAYRIAIDAGDTNGDGGAWIFTAPTAKSTLVTFVTEEV